MRNQIIFFGEDMKQNRMRIIKKKEKTTIQIHPYLFY